MKARKYISNGVALLMIGSIVILPNCGLADWWKNTFGGKKGTETTDMPGPSDQTDDDSAVLATMNGKPLITENMLEAEKKKLIESNPQMEAMISLMDPNQLNRNLVDGMTSREIIRQYVQEKGVHETEKYKHDLEMALAQVRDLLNTRYFMEEFKTEATDKEIEAFYNENKESMPNLLLSRGGVESTGVPFSDEKSAQDFLAKVRESKNNITAAAKQANVSDKVKNFNLVNSESMGIEPELRDKIVAIQKTPSLHKFKVGNEVWVVAAKRKEEPQYRDLASVRDEIKQTIEKDKTMKTVEEQVAQLKDTYKVALVEHQFEAPADNQAVAANAQAQAAKQAATAQQAEPSAAKKPAPVA